MNVKSKQILFGTYIHDARSKVESALSCYSLTKIEENLYEAKCNSTGKGLLFPMTAQVKLVPRGRNATLVEINVQNDGRGSVQRWGCKNMLESIESKILS